jgi:D-alanyl-D-alanine carboxypeptidase
MRRAFAGLCAFAVAALLTQGAWAAKKASPPQPPEPPLPVIHGPYIVADADSGRVIEEFDALRPWYPASTSKLMTIYVTFRAIAAGEIRFDSEILYSARAAAEPPSKMGFRPGTRIRLDDALKMMMVKSANDIAVAVAEGVGGSISGFAQRMNKESQRLGMTRSHWVNPNGLPDEGQRTSARDMALLARALLKDFPQFRDYYKVPAIQIGDKVLKNYNELLEHYPGATGMKTGFICASGYNLVASAKRGERELIAVVFGEYGGKARTQRAAELLDEGFSAAATAPEPAVLLADAASGKTYQQPLDMRPYVCGPRRATVASEANEDGEESDATDAAHLTVLPIYLGPPVVVSALVPADYGEPGFVARLPKPRPGRDAGLGSVLNAFAPTDGSSNSAPAAAIGAAAGKPKPLDAVAQ